MSKVRDLKKDVKHMVKHLLDECYTQLVYSETISQERLLDIISDIMVLEKETLSKISKKSYKRGDVKNTDYQLVANDFYNSIIDLAERISSLEY